MGSTSVVDEFNDSVGMDGVWLETRNEERVGRRFIILVPGPRHGSSEYGIHISSHCQRESKKVFI
jgi:hypothetical protein